MTLFKTGCIIRRPELILQTVVATVYKVFYLCRNTKKKPMAIMLSYTRPREIWCSSHIQIMNKQSPCRRMCKWMLMGLLETSELDKVPLVVEGCNNKVLSKTLVRQAADFYMQLWGKDAKTQNSQVCRVWKRMMTVSNTPWKSSWIQNCKPHRIHTLRNMLPASLLGTKPKCVHDSVN